MPSITHEALLVLLRQAPHLLAHLLGHPGARCTLLPGDLPHVVPIERHADLCVVLHGDHDLFTIVESHRSRDERKRLIWADYVASAAITWRHDILLVVLTFDERVARWARRPIRRGPSFTVQPVVLGPTEIAAFAAGSPLPEAAVLAALAHARAPRAEHHARAAIEAISTIDALQAAKYIELILAALPSALRKTLEHEMAARTIPRYDFLRRIIDDSTEQGVQQGVQQGVVIGLHQGQLATLLRQLERRFGPLPPWAASRLDAVTDPQLDRWTLDILDAPSLEALLGPE